MRLRELEIRDNIYMLEWMEDKTITSNFRLNLENVSIDRVNEFINKSKTDTANKHYAIVNEQDEYLGTVSLKNIDNTNKNAELAIVLRRSAIGKNIGMQATQEVVNIAFNKLGLQKVFLNVLSENIRAIKMYEKVGFRFEGEFIRHLYINNEWKNLKWYGIIKGEKYE